MGTPTHNELQLVERVETVLEQGLQVEFWVGFTSERGPQSHPSHHAEHVAFLLTKPKHMDVFVSGYCSSNTCRRGMRASGIGLVLFWGVLLSPVKCGGIHWRTLWGGWCGVPLGPELELALVGFIAKINMSNALSNFHLGQTRFGCRVTKRALSLQHTLQHSVHLMHMHTDITN